MLDMQVGNKSLYWVENEGVTVWRSYNTPVAIVVRGSEADRRMYIPNRKYSVTTSKHLSFIRDYYGIDKDECVAIEPDRIALCYEYVHNYKTVLPIVNSLSEIREEALPLPAWTCPDCGGTERTWSTDNCQWISRDVYYMEYMCEDCGCIYAKELRNTDTRIIGKREEF